MSIRKTWKNAAKAAMAAGAMIGTSGIVGATAGASPVNTLYVSTTGTDTGTCSTPATACATINFALGVAVAGDTIKVARGSYNQTVAITKAIRLQGAGAGSTTINGAGIDPGGTLYGVVYVGSTGGAVSVTGFTITNPVAYAYTGGEPEVVALADHNASDSVVFTKDVISEGTADTNAGTEFPIGVDTFLNAATTTISKNTISGVFQGALFEDNGPVSFTKNKVQHLISATDNSTSPPTVYEAEGVFFLSDTGGSLTNQNAIKNKFSHYAGDGLIMEAGYNNGNCSSTPCNGSISGTISHNHLALGSSPSADGIDLQSEFNGNNLTATVSNNVGYVTSPDQAIVQSATNGATISVSGGGNNIVVHP